MINRVDSLVVKKYLLALMCRSNLFREGVAKNSLAYNSYVENMARSLTLMLSIANDNIEETPFYNWNDGIVHLNYFDSIENDESVNYLNHSAYENEKKYNKESRETKEISYIAAKDKVELEQLINKLRVQRLRIKTVKSNT